MEMSQRLEQILGDESAMAQIRQLAQTLNPSATPAMPPAPAPPPTESSGGMDMGAMLSMLGPMLGGGVGASSGGGGSGPGDDNVQLLRALRPFLSQKRRRKVGQAVKIMQLMDMLPLLQESGMLNGLLGGMEDE